MTCPHGGHDEIARLGPRKDHGRGRKDHPPEVGTWCRTKQRQEAAHKKKSVETALGKRKGIVENESSKPHPRMQMVVFANLQKTSVLPQQGRPWGRASSRMLSRMPKADLHEMLRLKIDCFNRISIKVYCNDLAQH